MIKISRGLIAAGLLCFSSLTFAVPMLGGISFSSLPNTGFTFDATSFSFDSGPNAAVNTVTGDFANYFNGGDIAEFFDFTYAPFVGPQTVWKSTASVGANAGTALSFILDNASVTYQDSQLVVITGAGMLTDGVDQVKGQWNITANELGNSFSWSSSTAVPEPGTLALLGLGLAGLGAARRRQKA